MTGPYRPAASWDDLAGDPVYPYPDPTPPVPYPAAHPYAPAPPQVPVAPPPYRPARGRGTPWVWAAAALVVVLLVLLATTSGGHTRSTDPGAGPALPTVAAPSLPAAPVAPGTITVPAPTSGRTLVLPASVDGYPRLTGAPADQLRQVLTGPLAALGAPASNGATQVAGYGPAGSPKLVFLGLRIADVPAVQQLIATRGAQGALFYLLQLAGAAGAPGATPVNFPPGPNGGSLQCTHAQLSGLPAAACGWIDDTFFALTVVATPGDLDDAADLTLDLRNAAER